MASDQQLTNTGDLLGTIRYMAPEQLSGGSKPNCDIYGLGVTLDELLTLRPAIVGSSHAELLDGVRSQVPINPRHIDSSIPRDLQMIVLTSIVKDPLHRYRSAKDFADDLGRFLNDLPIKASQPSSIDMLLRWSRRNKTVALTIATALVLFAVVIPSIATVYSLMLRKEVSRSKAAELVANCLKKQKIKRAEIDTWLFAIAWS